MDTKRKPFEPLPFETLPERPRKPHDWFKARVEACSVHTDAFGTVETPVKVAGEGPPLLLVHGLMTSNYSWRYVMERFGRDFRVYAPDLPGAGRATMTPEADFDPRHLADWIEAFIDQRDIRGCAVVGNSLGGYLAMWLALRQPDAIGRLVNLHSPGIPTLRLRALHAALSLPGSHRLLRWWVGRAPIRWAHKNVHYRDEGLKSREEARIYAEPLQKKEGVQCFINYLADTLAPGPMKRFRDALRRRRDQGDGFPVPLQLVYADRDPMVPPEIGERLHELIPEAEMVRLEKSSHFAHIDTPESFVKAVRPFLSPGAGEA